MQPDRHRIMGQLSGASDAALLEMIDSILAHDPDAVQEVVTPLSRPAERIHDMAERLRAGRLAEAFFPDNPEKIADVSAALILDHREPARGYAFGVRKRDGIAIEVEGLKQMRGGILFTDRGWSGAKARRADDRLVVVGNIESSPVAKLSPDPTTTLRAECGYQTAIAVATGGASGSSSERAALRPWRQAVAPPRRTAVRPAVRPMPPWSAAPGFRRAAGCYAATVAVVTSLHGPFSPRVLTHRSM